MEVGLDKRAETMGVEKPPEGHEVKPTRHTDGQEWDVSPAGVVGNDQTWSVARHILQAATAYGPERAQYEPRNPLPVGVESLIHADGAIVRSRLPWSP